MAIRTKSEDRYAAIVTAWVKDNTSKLLMGEAQTALDDCPMNQTQFTAWAWDLYRLKRDPARDMYNELKAAKEARRKGLSPGGWDIGNSREALDNSDCTTQ
jgi:hypothetical protein